MDNDTNSSISFKQEFRGMMNPDEYSFIKTAVICVIIILNVIMNSLVIAVIARYPQLREDRTTLFMFSLSVSDLAAGCTFMPISAALCSGATPEVADMDGLLPKVYLFMIWWFGFNSMYCLCWLTISKMIVIRNPFKVEQLLTRKCCYVIIGMNWIIGCVLAIVSFNVNVTWNTMTCAHRIPQDENLATFHVAHFVIAVVIPVSLILYGTVRIIIVVMRTHRQISALEQSFAVGNNSTGKTGFVTVQAIRSSRNVIIICAVSLVLNTPVFAFIVLRYLTAYPIPDVFSFLSMWVFESNTFMNSLLYLLLFKSVRRKVFHMFRTIYTCIRER